MKTRRFWWQQNNVTLISILLNGNSVFEHASEELPVWMFRNVRYANILSIWVFYFWALLVVNLIFTVTFFFFLFFRWMRDKLQIQITIIFISQIVFYWLSLQYIYRLYHYLTVHQVTKLKKKDNHHQFILFASDISWINYFIEWSIMWI